ncbi:SWIM zinc finger family protein [Erwinia persicina]|uniref:SWIM zinc finger family protein n=1 Tax=Erwinia persicina TaxID=55211 RepID=UPI00177E1445|nr:SWIM zinc finger family protein [Erwinia persicina]MBD8213128.1 SWIM zinc finger family protein [Erwinia persicina]
MSAPVRNELLELTPQALIALSNAGLVKRSQKEIAAGNLPLFSDAEGVLTARFSEGTVTRLNQGQGLKEASCTCNASGMCRHRVMLVLGYQQIHTPVTPPPETRWQPGEWLDELASLPATTRKRAQQLAGKGLVIELHCAPGQVPAARLPMSDVRFFSRSSMRFARCDCIEGTLCEHIILAVQAFAAAEARHPGFDHLSWQTGAGLAGEPATQMPQEDGLAQLNDLSYALWSGGISQPAVTCSPLLVRAARHAQQADWRWVTLAVQQVSEGIDDFHQRASHYRAGVFLSQFAALTARLRAAREMAGIAAEDRTPTQPWRSLVGHGVQDQVRLDHLRLVSLGMQSWQNEQHYGVRIWFTDPDTGSVLHLSRQWPLAEQENAPGWQRRIAGFQADMLAGGQIISQAAQRDAKGELHLSARDRLNAVAPLTPAAWAIPDIPLCQPGVVALRQYLLHRPPAFTRPLSESDNLFILPLGECLSLRWDAGRQTLEAEAISGPGEDNVLCLSLSVSPAAPGAIDALIRVLQQQDDPPCQVSGLVSVAGGKLTLEPLVVMTGKRAWVLQAGPPSPQALPTAAVDHPLPLSLQLLQRCQQMLVDWLHNGLHHQEQRACREAEALAADLQRCGFAKLAKLAAQIPTRLRGADPEELVKTLTAFVLLRDRLEQECLLMPSAF